MSAKDEDAPPKVQQLLAELEESDGRVYELLAKAAQCIRWQNQQIDILYSQLRKEAA